jgi:hypothetical protein
MPPQTRRELLLGLYVGLVWNLGVGAILNNPLQSSTRTWFVTLGAANELLGVLMIASPELLPLMGAVASWAYTRSRAAVLKLRVVVRRLFHQTRVVSGSAGIAIEGTSSVTAGLVTDRHPPNATTDELVAWLIKEHELHNTRIVRLEQRQTEMPSEWQREIAAAKQAAQQHAQTLVRGLADRHLSLRLLGLGFVVLGLLLSTVGNLV